MKLYFIYSAIRDAISLLPPNPRAVRQFIRILALLKPQVDRHYSDELNWSVIISANILKVRHPRMSHELLGDTSFWNSVGMARLKIDGETEEKIGKSIDEQIKKVCEAIGVELEQTAKKEIKATMETLASQMGLFSGLYGESVAYQFNIAEAPTSVTWKEFDEMVAIWEKDQRVEFLNELLKRQANKVQTDEIRVFRETLRATVQRYGEALNRAENVLVETDKSVFLNRAKLLFALLKTLCFSLAKPESIGLEELQAIVNKFGDLANSNLPVHKEFWNNNETFILEMFKNWAGNAKLLMQVLEPYIGFLPRGFEGEAAGNLSHPHGGKMHCCEQVLLSYPHLLLSKQDRSCNGLPI